MKNYLALWDEGLPDRNSRVLGTPVTVVGEHIHGTKSEFAKVQLTVRPAKSFDVEDCVAEKTALERLSVEWPDPFIFGLLDVLVNAEPQPLTDIRSPWSKFGITTLIYSGSISPNHFAVYVRHAHFWEKMRR